jgi:hypothetical protein
MDIFEDIVQVSVTVRFGLMSAGSFEIPLVTRHPQVPFRWYPTASGIASGVRPE